MARNTSAIGSVGGKPKPKPKRKPAGFGATPAAPKKAAAPNIGAAIERGAKRGRTPPKPTGPKRPGLGATPGKPTAKPTKKLRGLQRETYKSLPLADRKRLSRPVKGTYGLAREKPQPDTDISGGVHAERMRANAAMRAAAKYKKGDKPTALQLKGARVATKIAEKQALKGGLAAIARAGGDSSSKRLNHVSGGGDKVVGAALLRAIPIVGQAAAQNRQATNAVTAAVRVPKNVARVVAEDPKKQVPKLATDAVKAIPASVAGVVGGVTDPKGAAKGIAADYKRRYKPLLQGNEEAFRNRMKKEGVLPEVLDTTAAISIGGATAGRALQKAGEAAASRGSTSLFARVAAKERPKLRVAAGDSAKAVRTQEKHANIVRNAARHATDVRRAKKTEKLAKRADASPEVRAAAASGGKEVVPLRKSTTKRAQRKIVAGEKGPSTYRLKSKQQRLERESNRNISKATGASKVKVKPAERKLREAALFYAQQFGIHTPQAARTHLAKRIKAIESERLAMAEKGVKIHSRHDELPILQKLAAEPERYFTKDIAEGAAKQRDIAGRAAAEDPALGVTRGERAANALTRTHAPQAELLGLTRREGEKTPDFIARVTKEAKAQGLESPGYVPSWKRTKGVFAARGVGGTRAVVPDKSYRGLNVAAGTQEPNPRNLTLQAMKNIKRGENWKLVSRHVENSTIDSLPDRKTGETVHFRDRSVKEIHDNLERAGVDPKDVVIVNVGRVREELSRQSKKLDEVGVDQALTDPSHQDPAIGLSKALEAGTAAATDPRYVKTRGFYVFSKAAWNEIEADAKPSSAGARSWDISKGKVSRVLLGNPAWATIQTAANTLQTGIGGAGPMDFTRGQRFARMAQKMTPDAQARAEAEAGIHRWFDPQQHLGAQTDNSIVNGYRAFKEGGLYQAMHKLNPLDAIFRYDTMETNAFRRTLFAKDLRKQVYEQTNRDLGWVAATQQRVGDLMTGRAPYDRMMALLENPEAVYRAAQATNDWLGDFTTYTARERRVLGRATMFYGFLRFSVKLALYTLPVKHPLRALMLLQLGRLTNEELKQIFGTDVPPYEIGNYYSKDGETRLPTARMNPFANAIQYETPRDMLRAAPPFVQILFDQAAKQDTFGKGWRVDGKSVKVADGEKVQLDDRLQIALAEFLHLNPGYRIAEKTGLDAITGAATGAALGVPGVIAGAVGGALFPQKPLTGKQGADSSLIFPQPTKYKPDNAGIPTVASLLGTGKRESGDAANQRRIAQQKKDMKRTRLEYFAPFGTPFAPPPGGKQRIAEARRYAQFQKDKKKKQEGGIPTLSQLLKGK